MKHLAIVNRRSGGVQSPQRLRSVLDQVERIASKTVFTEHAGHARELAARSQGFDNLIVVGGDGTLLEALNGVDLERQRLSVVPIGRGNSLARDLGLYPLSRSLAALHSGGGSRIDLMDVSFEDQNGTRHQYLSGSTIALGYPASVVRVAGTRFRRLGVHCYTAAAACARPTTTSVKFLGDSSVEKPLTGLVINNTRHLASFVALPDSCCRDGYFDVMEMSAGRIRQTLHNLSALSGLQFYNPVNLSGMTQIALELSEPRDLMIDGELFPGVVALRVAIRPAAAEFMVVPQRV
ncbi:MAG: diacylglycerol/lipid kinase family protein [Bryobacteraceae bacterium]